MALLSDGGASTANWACTWLTVRATERIEKFTRGVEVQGVPQELKVSVKESLRFVVWHKLDPDFVPRGSPSVDSLHKGRGHSIVSDA